jgi:uroporphyrin-III C-methyltransferase
MMRQPHPFAAFIRILGRGKSLARSLTESEAEEAMAMILAGDVLPEQLGAFLMLLRVKEETFEEIAGFTRAARAALDIPADAPRVDLDWSSYAGKRRQLPWFLLSALVLASAGWRVFMHGGEGHTPGRLYTSQALRALGFEPAKNLDEAAKQIAAQNFAYLTLDAMSARLSDMMDLKPILGLRSPVNSFSRLLNPFAAPVVLQSVFHPGYMNLHRDAGRRLGQPTLAVFRGEGGEIERRPNKPTEVWTLHDGAYAEERWPAMLDAPGFEADAEMDLSRLGAFWRGEIADPYAEAAVTGTLAIALKALGAAADISNSEARAKNLWAERDRAALPRSAPSPAPAQNTPMGAVYIVGAGPGDPDLLTLRAEKLMRLADVALYDRLANSRVMDLIPARVERVYVGKQPNAHELCQEEISALMAKLAREGKRVLRLKGGDPFLFGRGGEEIEYLAAHGVPFEVCPGVTAASGAASYAGIPLTHRDYSQACIFVTGHGKDGMVDLDWPALIKPNQTVAIYMGLANLETLTREFIARGARAKTPAAIVDNATRANQQVIVGTLETLAALARAADLKGPSIIIVGAVVALREKLLAGQSGSKVGGSAAANPLPLDGGGLGWG